MRSLILNFSSNSSFDLSLIAKQPYEKVHLRHLKYLLGINKKASNSAAWGECGSFPLFISCISRCVKYFQRIMNLDKSTFVKAAINEQIKSSLSWYNGVRDIINCFDEIQPSDYNRNTCPLLNSLGMACLCSPDKITHKIKEVFTESWKFSITNSPKLSFYCTVKEKFNWETYLDVPQPFRDRRVASQIRSSSHKLNVETGRYSGTPRAERVCDYCSGLDSFSTPIEDELHLLNSCPQGQDIRSSNYTKNLQRILPNELIDINHTHSLSSALRFSSFQNSSMSSATQPHTSLTNSIIRLTCNSINRIYALSLQLKKDLKSKSKPT